MKKKSVRADDTILVIGGSQRTGREIAFRLAQEGWSLLIHYHETASDEIGAMLKECYALAGPGQSFTSIQADLETPGSASLFIQHIQERIKGSLYGVVYSVGLFITGAATAVPMEEAYRLFQYNFFAPCAIIQSLCPLWRHAGRGAVVVLGTAGLNRFSADTFAPMYSASKQAMLYFIKSFAKELAPYHVSVNMISPGKLENSVDRDDASHLIPYGRMGRVDEVAEVVAFCMDESKSYITGQNIEVSGGFCL